jgi:hypothetical protein
VYVFKVEVLLTYQLAHANAPGSETAHVPPARVVHRNWEMQGGHTLSTWCVCMCVATVACGRSGSYVSLTRQSASVCAFSGMGMGLNYWARCKAVAVSAGCAQP